MIRKTLLRELMFDAVAKFIHEKRRSTVGWTSEDMAKVIISVVEYHLKIIERGKWVDGNEE